MIGTPSAVDATLPRLGVKSSVLQHARMINAGTPGVPGFSPSAEDLGAGSPASGDRRTGQYMLILPVMYR